MKTVAFVKVYGIEYEIIEYGINENTSPELEGEKSGYTSHDEKKIYIYEDLSNFAKYRELISQLASATMHEMCISKSDTRFYYDEDVCKIISVIGGICITMADAIYPKPEGEKEICFGVGLIDDGNSEKG